MHTTTVTVSTDHTPYRVGTSTHPTKSHKQNGPSRVRFVLQKQQAPYFALATSSLVAGSSLRPSV